MTEHVVNSIVKMLIIFFVLMYGVVAGYAEQSIEDIAKSGLAQTQGFASSEGSGNQLPNYSRDKVEQEAESIDKIDDAEMKTKAHNAMTSADSSSAEGITRDAMGKKTLDGFEEHELFTKAEKIWADPVSEMKKITSEGCKEKVLSIQVNKQSNQYRKKVTKEKHYDTELYEETCEKPASNIVCEKTLSVSCGNLSDCGFDAGGITKDSIDGNIYWRANYPNIYLGTIDKVRQRKECVIMDKKVTFRIKDKGAVKEFRITNIQYSDWIRVSVNGVQAYNTMGGNGDFWKEGSSQWTTLHSGSARRTCNTKEFYNISPNVDLKPYLREGHNTMRIELAFGNSGRLYLKLKASQYCCRNFNDKWEKRCWEG